MKGDPSKFERVEAQVMLIYYEGIVNADAVARETRNDPVLRKVGHYTRNGWPTEIPTEFLPYHNRRIEITIEQGVLLWDGRVSMPLSLQSILLQDLHSEHTGIVRMKRMARRYLWRPKLDKEIEEAVNSCNTCQENASAPSKATGNWSWPAGPWKRLHLDFAGPYMGQMFLGIVAAYSKYLDVVPMVHATTKGVLYALRQNFAIFGLPEHLVTNNGSQFTSEELAHFLKMKK